MLPQTPDPTKSYMQLLNAISENKRPTALLYELLASDTTEGNLIGNYIIQYKDSVKLLCSPRGREWLQRWLKDFLDYLQKIAETT